MGLNISLFVHGVPMGQKVYGPKGDDQMYINSFYGPKWDAPELLKVDVMAFGGTPYCYYSFVKGVNVCDSQGRAGSYFALTLRINALYTDFQNVYSILNAAYNKMCVGLCVQDNGSVIKYSIADFDTVEPQLKAIEQQIINYISEFSITEDIVSATGLKCNANTLPITVNLHECTQQVAIRGLQSVGRLLVSPYYPSSQTAQQIATYKTEMQNIQLQARQEIEDISRSYEEKLRLADALHHKSLQECIEQAESNVLKAKEEAVKKVNEINARYADVDAKVENLKKEKTQFEKEKKTLQAQLKEKEDSISKLEKKMNRRDEDFEKLKRQLEELKSHNVSQSSISSGDIDRPNQTEQDEQSFFNLKKALSHLALFFILAFVVLGVWYALDSRKSGRDQEMSVNTLENVDVGYTTAEAKVIPIVESKIHIIWGRIEGAICPNEKLQFEFQGDKNLFDAGAVWTSDELVIKDNQISVTPGCNSDSCKLSLTIEGTEIDHIIIPIQK